MSRRAAAWVALAAVVVVTLAIVAWPSGGKPSQAPARAVGELRAALPRLREPVDRPELDRDRPRRPGRHPHRVAAGQSDAEIRQAYIDKFGPSILLKPESGGLGILVWGLPAAALVLGAGGLVLALRRWRREPHLHPTDADRELVQHARP